jgi:protein-tyrosine phosphatase
VLTGSYAEGPTLRLSKLRNPLGRKVGMSLSSGTGSLYRCWHTRTYRAHEVRSGSVLEHGQLPDPEAQEINDLKERVADLEERMKSLIVAVNSCSAGRAAEILARRSSV